MFSTTRGSRFPARRKSAAGLKMLPPAVEGLEKERSVSGALTKSMSKATICCLRIRSCFSRKSCASAGTGAGVGLETLRVRMALDAATRERVVWWTMRWARSSKTVD